MASTTAINVTYVDNELYILATNGWASYELLHYVSGHMDAMNLTIVPQHVLPPGDYTLVFVLVNWSATYPAGLSASLTTDDGVNTSVPVPSLPQQAGVVWSYNTSITV